MRRCWLRTPGPTATATTARWPTWGPPRCAGWPAPTIQICQGRRSSMPELPEVETIRRALAPRVEGRRIARLRIHDARWCQPLAPQEFVAAVESRRIEALRRRGKYFHFELSDDVHLLWHLRMTGTLLYDGRDGSFSRPPVVRVDVDLDDGHRLVFV